MASPQTRRRIVASYKQAFVHPTEKDRERYLKRHPDADPAKHTVRQGPGKGAPVKEEPTGAPKAAPKPPKGKPPKPGQKPVAPKPEGKAPPVEGKPNKAPPPAEAETQAPQAEAPPKKGILNNLSSKAKSFLSTASDSVKSFVLKPEVRKKAIAAAGSAILKAPGAYAKRLVDQAKHEIHEFKEAGQALGDVMKGKKLTPKQVKVVKTVAVHLGIAVAAASLTSTGLLAGAAVFAKSIARKVAIRAARESLEKLHTLEEVSHIGHGAAELLHHVLASEGPASAVPPVEDQQQPEGLDSDQDQPKDQLSPEEAFGVLVTQTVLKYLKNLDDETIAQAMEAA